MFVDKPGEYMTADGTKAVILAVNLPVDEGYACGYGVLTYGGRSFAVSMIWDNDGSVSGSDAPSDADIVGRWKGE